MMNKAKGPNPAWHTATEVPITDYEHLGELMLAVKTQLTLPVILTSENGRSRHLILPETRDAVVQGMMIAMEHKLEAMEHKLERAS